MRRTPYVFILISVLSSISLSNITSTMTNVTKKYNAPTGHVETGLTIYWNHARPMGVASFFTICARRHLKRSTTWIFHSGRNAEFAFPSLFGNIQQNPNLRHMVILYRMIKATVGFAKCSVVLCSKLYFYDFYDLISDFVYDMKSLPYKHGEIISVPNLKRSINHFEIQYDRSILTPSVQHLGSFTKMFPDVSRCGQGKKIIERSNFTCRYDKV